MKQAKETRSRRERELFIDFAPRLVAVSRLLYLEDSFVLRDASRLPYTVLRVGARSEKDRFADTS